MGQVYATFPGVERVKSCFHTRTLGHEPDAATITCVPQATPPSASGTLVFANGANVLSLPDFGVDYSTVQYSTYGRVGAFILWDTRRRWKWLKISGRYNILAADGTIVAASEKTPQELATLLLTALGVATFDVTVIPNDDRPSVNWQRSRADLALSELLSTRGCEIALNTDNSVTIVNLGTGATLVMDGDSIGAEITFNPPDVPENIVLLCGKSMWQSRLKLIAVGLDTDGSWKPIADLSYMPAGGWADCVDDEHFLGIEDPIARDLAIQTVYKCYQIESQADGTQDILDYTGTIDDISQLLPINNWRLETYEISGTTVERKVRSRVMGTFLEPGDPPPDINTEPMTTHFGYFDIDRERGIVTFAKRVMKLNDTLNQRVAADLFLETSYGILNFDSQQYERAMFTFDLEGSLAGSHDVRDDNLVALSRITYDDDVDPLVQDAVVTNQETIEDEALARLTAEAAQFLFDVGTGMEYRTIKAIETDGAILQVTWKVDCNAKEYPSKTIVSRNCETAIGVPRLKEKRRRRVTNKKAERESRDEKIVQVLEDQGRDR